MLSQSKLPLLLALATVLSIVLAGLWYFRFKCPNAGLIGVGVEVAGGPPRDENLNSMERLEWKVLVKDRHGRREVRNSLEL
jgi:hypothetical protein